jgi:tape measure domain-containing protein
MADNVGAIYYTVEAETGELIEALKSVNQSLNKLNEKFDDTDKHAKRLDSTMTGLARAIKAVIAASALREMAGMVQKYQEMAERVRMATDSQAEFEMVQRRLLDTANGTYRSLEEAQELYIRTADSLRSMGYSTEQALDVTDSMSYAFVKNATSADRAEAAISQFSKSMNTGKVSADQWETISSAIPTVINDIAKASGKTGAEIRKLGAEGKLTAAQLSEGLRKSLDENAKAAAGMASNLTDAGVRARTAITAVLVAMEERSGALQAFTDGIIKAADAVLGLAGDGEAMAAIMDGLTTAGMALSAVIAGRLIGAFLGFAAAQVRAATTMGVATVAANGLRTAMAFLGGPAGVILLAATAIYTFAKSSADAKPSVDLLSESISDLGDATLKLRRVQIQDKLAELEGAGGAAMATGASVEYLKKQLAQFPNSAKAEEWTRRIVEQEAAAEAAGAELAQYRARLKEVDDALALRATPKPKQAGGAPDPNAPSAKDTDALKKQIDALWEQADVLGMTATETALYKLQLAGATDEQLRSAASALALIDANEKLAESEEELNKQKEKFGSDPDRYIRGDSGPLSGGAFDTQSARYAAEADAERQRYADQLTRLQEARRLQIQTKQEYDALEEQMAAEHQSRMNQIAVAGATSTLNNAANMFGSMAELYKSAEGEQSRSYQNMFALSKVFAIASAGMNLSLAMAQALADPSAVTLPQKLANYAAVGSAGAGLAAQIGSAAFAGRQYGGPVAAGSMYRINETGAPEVFNAANGRQYMLPNQRGEVVSNAEASRQTMPNIQVINNGPPVSVRQELSGNQIKLILDLAEDRMAGSITRDGKVGKAAQRAFGLGRAAK